MDQERIDNYSSEVSSWISKQGFFFQIFQGPRLLGKSASLVAFLGSLFAKIFLFCLLIGFGLFIKASQDHTSPAFAQSLGEKIKNSLQADEVTVHNLKSGTASLTELPNVLIKGSEKSFFERLKIQNAEIDLGSFIARKKSFDVTTITCSKLELQTKITPESQNTLSSMYAPLFNENDWFLFQHLKAKQFKCEWGHSDTTRGSIVDANLEMTRQKGEGWIVKITNGTFSYAWMKELNIHHMLIDIKSNSFEIVEAEFEKNGATFDFNLTGDCIGTDPRISGEGTIKNAKVRDLFKPEYSDLIHGTLYTNFTFQGSPSIEDGCVYNFTPLVPDQQEAGAPIQPESHFRFKHSIKLFRALTTLDTSVNYKTYDFDVTDWSVKLQGDKVNIHQADLRNSNDNSVKVLINLDINEPQPEYIERIVSLPKAEIKSRLQKGNLREKAQEILRMKGSISKKPRLDRADYIKLFKTERHLSGTCQVTLHEKSFLNNIPLAEKYPCDTLGYRHLNLDFSGPPNTFTNSYADMLYKLGRN